jgi:hypothetical protein
LARDGARNQSINRAIKRIQKVLVPSQLVALGIMLTVLDYTPEVRRGNDRSFEDKSGQLRGSKTATATQLGIARGNDGNIAKSRLQDFQGNRRFRNNLIS